MHFASWRFWLELSRSNSKLTRPAAGRRSTRGCQLALCYWKLQITFSGKLELTSGLTFKGWWSSGLTFKGRWSSQSEHLQLSSRDYAACLVLRLYRRKFMR